ncbi:penicillin-binding protein 1A [Tistlia consotensis]|uniref:Penicillin-binding protein 1A n=1 Tax=Tistlia consotensis USBA 355 TaxID=560819 RepID=A0A1Y6BAU4_9PROT|nr:penicillin-binding protein 1A [Tistlia consotensis]SME93868.1 penicillin-binding protein 1A [Tistlia consotensis USBA 355]SNR28891.1 penicillin-binding protein 1A [Tistlia consotensis]
MARRTAPRGTATPALRADIETSAAERRLRGAARSGSGGGRSAAARGGSGGGTGKRAAARPRDWRWLRRLALWTGVAAIWGAVALGGLLAWYAYDLPSVSALGDYTRKPSIRLIDADGRPLAAFGDLYGDTIPVADLPAYLPQAVMAVEDRRFYSHFGIDPWGILRALVADVMAGQLREGGSTITQQLAKNLFLTPDRTIKRKVQEMMLAIWLETKLSKDRILSLYLNRVYLGAGTYGVDAAAHRYFGKSAREVGLYEAAMIAGLLKAPSRYNPANDPDLAHRRASTVLHSMAEAGFITEAEAERAIRERKRGQPQVADRGRYFADWALSRVAEEAGPLEGDVVVSTTLDSRVQRIAEEETAKLLDGAARKAGAGQAAVVVMGPDGAVKAMVGGRSYGDSQFNRAVQALRQPGSSFKPFVYLAALESGMTPDSPVLDAPIEFKTPNGVWRPSNFTDKYRGTVTLREALARSLNTPAVRLAESVGVDKVAAVAHRMGITTPLAENLSLALGSSEVSVLDMATAYSVLANGGDGVLPYGVSRIESADGQLIYDRHGGGLGRVIPPAVQASMVDMMQSAVAWGTARHADPGRPAAAKTGTSQDFRDAWFVGFTADWTVAVWLGNDDGKPMDGVTGGSLPAQLWRAIMTRISAGLPPRPLVYAAAVPSGAGRAGEAPASDQGGGGPGLLENLIERLTGSGGGTAQPRSDGAGRRLTKPGNDR